jgi:hypothetical chaperone protein
MRPGASRRVIGIDFGTTNSVLTMLDANGAPRTARFVLGEESHDVFRSVLCYWQENDARRIVDHHEAGPWAIRAYLEDSLDSRLIMSMKTYLAQKSFRETRIYGRPTTLEAMIATFLRAFFARADLDVGPGFAGRVVVGRPVRFAGERADHEFAESRLREAYREAGLPEVEIAYEPEGAGYGYARSLAAPATVLVADFGGGTSDFSLIHFDFTAGEPRAIPLGSAGIGIAGDNFDYRIIDHLIAPALGKGETYRVMGKDLYIPQEYYSDFARWHRLSMLRTPKTLRDLREIARVSSAPDKIADLIAIIEHELGFQLYQSVSRAKAALSQAEETTVRFQADDIAIEAKLTRADFERWIADDLARIDATVSQALANASVAEHEVDRVFLTGGTSFVPAIRRLFAERFGAEKISAGGEFVSVAEGLALIGRDIELGLRRSD